jgi:hypothetical protein
MPDEEAFCLLVRLMYSYDVRGHFLPEMPKLQLRLVSVLDLSIILGSTDERGMVLSFRWVHALSSDLSSLMEPFHTVRPTNRRITPSSSHSFSSAGRKVKHVLFTVVSHPLFLPVESSPLRR